MTPSDEGMDSRPTITTHKEYTQGEKEKKEGSLDAAAPPPLVASADTLYELNGATWGDTHTQTI